MIYLSAGIELLKKFHVEVDTRESERQELANAEKLFDLSITMYPELLEVQKVMKGLDQIYSLYDEQTVRTNIQNGAQTVAFKTA